MLSDLQEAWRRVSSADGGGGGAGSNADKTLLVNHYNKIRLTKDDDNLLSIPVEGDIKQYMANVVDIMATTAKVTGAHQHLVSDPLWGHLISGPLACSTYAYQDNLLGRSRPAFTSPIYGHSVSCSVGEFVFATSSSRGGPPFYKLLGDKILPPEDDAENPVITWNYEGLKGLYTPDQVRTAWKSTLEEENLTNPMQYAIWWLRHGGAIGTNYHTNSERCELCGFYYVNYLKGCSCDRKAARAVQELFSGTSSRDLKAVIGKLREVGFDVK